MLVLTRKLNERIMIGDEIEITVLSVGEEKVQIGITAPRSVPVHRREVYEEILKENMLASRSALPSIDTLCGLGLSTAEATGRARVIEGPGKNQGEKRRRVS
jgi:carbon storage regulator